MEIKMEQFSSRKFSAAETVEYPIENDFFLPEQFPDMDVILHSETTACITDKNLYGGKLRVEGIMVNEIVYRDKEGLSHGVKSKVPFSKMLEPKQEAEYYRADVSVSYMNYRMINERRTDIRGALALCIKGCSLETVSFISEVPEDTVCTNKMAFSAFCSPIPMEKRMVIREDVDLSGNAAAMDQVLTSSAYPEIDEIKIVSGKVVVKGGILIDCLLVNQKGEGTAVQYTIPFHQVLDSDQIQEDSRCSYSVKCNDFTALIDEGASGRILTISADLSLSLNIYSCLSFSGVDDAYSTERELKMKNRKFEYYDNPDWINTRNEQKTLIKIQDSVSEVLHAHCAIDEIQTLSQDDEIKCHIKYHAVCFYLNEESLVCTAVQNFETDVPLANRSNSVGDLFVSVGSVTFVLDRKGIAVQTTFILSGNVFEKKMIRLITEIAEGEELEHAFESCLLLSFEKKGTSLWSIGKKYHVSAERIREENDFKNTQLTKDQALMIPVFHVSPKKDKEGIK